MVETGGRGLLRGEVGGDSGSGRRIGERGGWECRPQRLDQVKPGAKSLYFHGIRRRIPLNKRVKKAMIKIIH